MNFKLTNSGNSSSSYETIASISFIPMRRMSLWFLIMKKKDIIMSICVCPNRQMNLILKMVEREVFPMKAKYQYN